MTSLLASHKGYNFQDIVSAFTFARSILLKPNEIIIDQKKSPADLFDDLRIIHDGFIRALQFKFSEEPTTRFQLTDLKTKSRDTRLDHLIKSYLDDESKEITQFRIVSTLLNPNDDLINFIEITNEEPYFGGTVFKLKTSSLWPENGDFVWKFKGAIGFQRDDLINFSNSFRIELSALRPSFDMRNPGPLEILLLNYLKDVIGIGSFPNQNKEPFDVAIHLINLAARFRQSSSGTNVDHIIQQIQLKIDFGKVAQELPVDLEHFVNRTSVINDLIDMVVINEVIALEGPPGSGKSWLINKVITESKSRGIPVLHHYCYLGPFDQNIRKRIDYEVFYGNLIAQLVEFDPSLQQENRPYYSASRQSYLNLLNKAAERFDNVIIVVDGLDHIVRVLNQNPEIANISTSIVSEISSWILPLNVRLLLSAQPGAHFDSFQSRSKLFVIPKWQENETLDLLNTFLPTLNGFNENNEEASSLFHQCARGNPLYLTYLIKGFIASYEENKISVSNFLKNQVSINDEEDINKYYAYLISVAKELGIESRIIRLFGLVEFSLNEQDIIQILGPLLAPPKIVKECLAILRPILNFNSSLGGYRIYHESFKRYVYDLVKVDGISLKEALSPIVSWLENKGFYKNSLSFNFLLPILQRSDRHEDVLEKIDINFVTNSLEHGFPHQSIDTNLIAALNSCTSEASLSKMILIWELRRAVYEVFHGKMVNTDLQMEYLWCVGSLKGWKRLSESLLHENEPVLEKIEGIKICHLCDEFGVVAPWERYLELADPEGNDERLEYEISRFVGLCRTDPKFLDRVIRYLNRKQKKDPRFVKGIFKEALRIYDNSVIEKIRLEIIGASRDTRRSILFAICEHRIKHGNSLDDLLHELKELCSHVDFASTLFRYGLDLKLFKFRIPDYTKFKIGLDGQSHSIDETEFGCWINSIIAISTHEQKILIAYAESINKSSWYNCWLYFYIYLIIYSHDKTLSDVERAKHVQSKLEILSSFDKPFRGQPRVCDLYSIRKFTNDSFRLTLQVARLADNLNKVIDLLVKISENTTTYLQHSPGGPLIHVELLEIILEVITDPIQLKEIACQLKELSRASEVHGEYYAILASQQFSLTKLYIRIAELELANDCFKIGCNYLFGYGERKDPTIYEIIDSLSTFGNDKTLACELSNKTLNLLTAVINHTDGKGTNSVHKSWFANTVIATPEESLVLLGNTLNSPRGFTHWLVDDCLEVVVRELFGKMSPVVTYGLEMGLRVDDSYSIDKKRGKKIAELMSRVDVSENQKNNLLAHLIQDAKKYDPNWIEELSELQNFNANFEVPDGVVYPDNRDYSNKDKKKDISHDQHYKAILAGRTFHELDSELKNIGYSLLESEELFDALSTIVGYRLCQLLSDDNHLEYRNYIDSLASNLRFSKNASFWEFIGDGLLRYGYSKEAIEAYVLCHCRTRGGGGWLVLGGQYTSEIIKKAFDIDKQTTIQEYLRYVSEEAKSQPYSYGLSRHVIEDMTAFGMTELKVKCWNTAFDVISKRLPSKRSSTGIFPHALTSEFSLNFDEASIYLVLCQINHAEEYKKSSALYSFSKLLLSKNIAVVTPLRLMLRINSSLLTISILLGALEEFDDGTIAGQLSSELLSYTSIEHFYISRTSSLLLDRIGVKHKKAPKNQILLQQSFLSETDIRILKELDWANRFYKIYPIAPQIPSIVNEVLKKRIKEEDFIETCKDRYEFFYDKTEKATQPTPALMWENEEFDIILNHVLFNYPFSAHYPAFAVDEIEENIRHTLIPRASEVLSYFQSRILRPKWPLPKDSKTQDVLEIKKIDSCEYNDWLILSRFEKQVVSKNKYFLPDGLEIVREGVIFYKDYVPNNTMLPIANENQEFELSQSHPACKLRVINGVVGVKRILVLNEELIEKFQLEFVIDGENIFYKKQNGQKCAVFRRWSGWFVGYDANGKYPLLEGEELIVEPNFWKEIQDVIGFPFIFRTLVR